MKSKKLSCSSCGAKVPEKEGYPFSSHKPSCQDAVQWREDVEADREGRPSNHVLETIRKMGGTWASYQNQALDSTNAGHLQFLKYGEGCTFQEPPDAYPADTMHGMGWKYRLIGKVDLETGKILGIAKTMNNEKENT